LNLGPYLLRRLLLAVPIVLGVLLAVFLLIRLVPGDVVTQLIGLESSISPQRVDELAGETLGNRSVRACRSQPSSPGGFPSPSNWQRWG
jgi:ABC-type dipeptide/oligopeptide/nickel transport system permease component